MIINILKAQAYYCLYSKMDKTTSNKSNLVKIANTIAHYYNLAHDIITRDPIRRYLGKEYAETIQSKELQFRASAHYWQSFSEKASGEEIGKGFGIAVCRLRLASRLIQQATSFRIKGKTLENARKI
mmetsp:Transcript_18230/g.2962  ORF Transcript_18230/g.2962 Transcript_18230/m.2962 type:complete len:127 (-) Transcript_18230:1538-1918(-)